MPSIRFNVFRVTATTLDIVVAELYLKQSSPLS